MVMGFDCFGDFVSFRSFHSFHFGGFVSLFQVLVHAHLHWGQLSVGFPKTNVLSL